MTSIEGELSETPRLPFRYGWLATIVVAVLVMHVIAYLALDHRKHFDSPADFAFRGDGPTYMAMADFMVNGHELDYHSRRVFLGLPLVLAAFIKIGLPVTWAGVTLSFLCVAGMLCVLALLFKNYQIPLLLAVFPPHWALDRAVIMNEPLLLFFSVSGAFVVLRFDKSYWIIGTLFLAYATLVRPNAIFVSVGIAAAFLLRQHYRDLFIFAALLLVSLACIHLPVSYKYWSIFESAHVYATSGAAYASGRMIDYPFASYVLACQNGEWRQAQFWYKAIHLIVAVTLVAVIIRRTIKQPSALSISMATWAVLGVLFAVSVGTFWGVRIQHRSLVWSLPALSYGLIEAPALPKWAFIGAALFSALFMFFAPITVG